MKVRRAIIVIKVAVDLDGTGYGTFSQAEDFSKMIESDLKYRVPHYRPEVEVLATEIVVADKPYPPEISGIMYATYDDYLKSDLANQHKFDCANDDHDISGNAFKCASCGKELCEICQSGKHSTGEGHDLSNPQYWGV